MVAYRHNAMAGGRGNYIGALSSGAQPMRSLILVPLASSYGSCGVVIWLAMAAPCCSWTPSTPLPRCA